MNTPRDALRTPLRRSHLAPEPRTLIDIFNDTLRAHPEALAVDAVDGCLTYAEFAEAAADVAHRLAAVGVGHGDRVGVRVPSGTTDLYVAILGTLLAGAAYVPVDADDPDERAVTVFSEAAVAATIGENLEVSAQSSDDAVALPTPPGVSDDAWIIFTSGSTGTPKGVAVTHRNAAAFVDAEADLFLQDAPINEHDRVMAGLSVAFDASCEEMWLAWRSGACLVAAPRSLVRSGVDLGPWLIERDITVVSTVPTLLSLWPADALAKIRLLILGGEACPPEIGARFATEGREVWNTYGPTEATVVTCAAQLTGEPPVRIGLPLNGWDMAVVDAEGQEVDEGAAGELIIGGVGLARYLDDDKDREKYAPMPTLDWPRAYRSGDLVTRDEEGLVFLGRMDDQVKVGGRRIELGEIDAALLDLPGVDGAAAAVRVTGAGTKILVGYVVVSKKFDATAATARLRKAMPAALVPRLAVVDHLPTKTSGKIDRGALPWPLPKASKGGDLTGASALVAEVFSDVLGATVSSPKDDFFDLGGSSLSAAHIVARLRDSYPDITVSAIYRNHTVGALAEHLDRIEPVDVAPNPDANPVPVSTKALQLLALPLLRTITGLRYLTWAALVCALGHDGLGLTYLPHVPYLALAVAWFLLIFPLGRILLAAAGARLITRGITAGTYTKGGRTHLRIWLAERFTEECHAITLASAPLIRWYARLLGAHVGPGVDLHTVPPVTGLLALGKFCAVEPEVDLSGHIIDGDQLIVGHVTIGARARVGARSTIMPGATVGSDAEVAAGSSVLGHVPRGEHWSGSPAKRSGPARGPWRDTSAASKPWWNLAYVATGTATALLPFVAMIAGVAPFLPFFASAATLQDLVVRVLVCFPAATLLAYLCLGTLIIGTVRGLSAGLRPGVHPVHGRIAWQAWSTVRVLDESRTWLFPLYASIATPWWFRALGARIGSNVEASTALMIPSLVSVASGAFLADDTLIGGYELNRGWMRLKRVKVGKNAFVGNSGMAAPGRKVPKGGLVAVLSAAPEKKEAKKGTSWIGSPPEKLRRDNSVTDDARTYAPTRALKVARAVVEAGRFIAVVANVFFALAAGAAMMWLVDEWGLIAAAVLSGWVVIGVGIVAAFTAVVMKWVLVGRASGREHPLWSTFVWRGELADAFVETLAAPWLLAPCVTTPVASWFWRACGARIGHGTWVETYWLPEPDLVRIGDGATVGRGCVVQTHLFHDRVLQLSEVHLGEGACVGVNSVVLPGATVGAHATVGSASLVMRGETVPDRSRWVGNPISPWRPRKDAK